MSPREVDERRAEAISKGDRRAPCELTPGSGPTGNDDRRRRTFQRGEVGLVQRDRQETVAEEALARRYRLGRRGLRRGLVILGGAYPCR